MTKLRLFKVTADRETGEWFADLADTGKTIIAENWFKKCDSRKIHFDTCQIGEWGNLETIAVKVTFK